MADILAAPFMQQGVSKRFIFLPKSASHPPSAASMRRIKLTGENTPTTIMGFISLALLALWFAATASAQISFIPAKDIPFTILYVLSFIAIVRPIRNRGYVEKLSVVFSVLFLAYFILDHSGRPACLFMGTQALLLAMSLLWSCVMHFPLSSAQYLKLIYYTEEDHTFIKTLRGYSSESYEDARTGAPIPDIAVFLDALKAPPQDYKPRSPASPLSCVRVVCPSSANAKEYNV
jgi:hypothetical protein